MQTGKRKHDMFNFIFDAETNGILLQESEKPVRREIRPVYCHELDMLGLKDRWRYPSDDSAPVMPHFFGTTESALQHKIDEFRDDGCSLFE